MKKFITFLLALAVYISLIIVPVLGEEAPVPTQPQSGLALARQIASINRPDQGFDQGNAVNQLVMMKDNMSDREVTCAELRNALADALNQPDKNRQKIYGLTDALGRLQDTSAIPLLVANIAVAPVGAASSPMSLSGLTAQYPCASALLKMPEDAFMPPLLDLIAKNPDKKTQYALFSLFMFMPGNEALANAYAHSVKGTPQSELLEKCVNADKLFLGVLRPPHDEETNQEPEMPSSAHASTPSASKLSPPATLAQTATVPATESGIPFWIYGVIILSAAFLIGSWFYLRSKK